ncbi:MAG: response regulator [bacterium]|nr:response regulator [bacterium]
MIDRLLIVDDEEAILYAYRRLFESPKLEVDTAANLEDAIVLLEKNNYKALLTDLRLGIVDEMGGFDVIRKAKECHKDIRIILATAYGTPQVKKTAKEVGVDHFLEKPVPLKELKKIFRKINM